MKKYLILFVILTAALTSCSIDDDGSSNIAVEILPIDSVEVPDEFVLGQTHEILITYTRPSACYAFYDFYYKINGNERTVGIVNAVYNDNDCDAEPESVTVTLNFRATGTGPYLFKFYQGEDDMGEDQYLLVEVPVADD